MNDAQRRKQDKLDREDAFVVDSAADFPAGSSVALLTAEINVERALILQYDAEKVTEKGDRQAAQEMYETRRDEIIDLLDTAELAAEIVEDEIEGTAAQFRNNYPRPDHILIARCTSVFNNSEAIKSEMHEAGFTNSMRTRLLEARDEFQQAAVTHDTSEERHAAATGGLNASFRKAMALSKRRDKRIRMKYRDNAAKLAAWTVASHLDRAPKKNGGGNNSGGNNGGNS